MKDLTRQEKIIVALMRGYHLDDIEIETAKQQVEILNLHINNRVK
jgi:hypothetical protein